MIIPWLKLALLAIIAFETMFCQKLLHVSINAKSTSLRPNGCNLTRNTSFHENTVTCRTLNEGLRYVNESLNKSTFPTSIVIVVQSNVSLEKEAIINGAFNLTILSPDEVVEVNGTCTDRNEECKSSMVFLNIQHLKIENMKLLNFGNFRLDEFCYSAVVIKNVENIAVRKISILHSTGGMCFKNISGSVSIMQSELFDNWVQPSKTCEKSSGGLWISTGHNVASVYHISECSFTENRAGFFRNKTKKHLQIGKNHGGGFLFYTAQNAKTNLTVTDTNFTNNRATFGGGAAILASRCNKNSSINVQMKRCKFSNNTAEKSIMSNGGGLQLLLQSGNTNVEISETNFISNKAYFGGGTSIGSQPNESGMQNAIFINCTWHNNTASSGAAIDCSRMYTDKKVSKPMKLVPVFKSCLFINNQVEYNQTKRSVLQESLGNGIFSISMMDATFDTMATFSNNSGSAIVGMGTTLTFNCSNDANFTNNNGINGGAISLEAFSRLDINSETRMFFISNHANSNGGAIYFHISFDHMLFVRSICPFTRSINRSEIYFCNNTAAKSGHSMYFTSLLPCQMEFSPKDREYLKAEEIFENDTYFQFHPNRTDIDVATAPSRVKHFPNTLPFHPGEEITLNLTITDNLNHRVDHPVFFQLFKIANQNNTHISSNSKIAMCISENKISLTGREGEEAEILLQTVDKPVLNIMFKVKMTSCPAGYLFNDVNNTCKCQPNSFYGFVNCTSTGPYKAYIFSKVWIGYIKADKTDNKTHLFFSGLCYWFCHNNIMKVIPKHHSGHNIYLYQHICHKHREGILCSNCTSNYSSSFNAEGYQCIPNEKCNLGWLFLILSEFLPFTAMLIIVMVMNINVASGYIQGFLLFSHIITTLPIRPRVYNNIGNAYRYIFHIFYYPLDLKFYKSLPHFCLIKGVTALQNVAMTYITIIYSLFLIFIVVMFMRCFNRKCHNCNRFIRFTTAKNSAIHGLLALFLLSYTRCIETSLILLQPTTLYGENLTLHSRRLAINGNLLYFSLKHSIYAIPAILFLILFLIPSVMLFLYPFFVKLQLYFNIEPRYAKTSYIISKLFMYNTLKPFYDMFYGSFHDDHRYFAGLYLFYRILIALPFYLPVEVDEYVVTEILLIAFLLTHAIAQPYAEKRHNTVDALLLATLVNINGMSTIDIIIQYSKIDTKLWNVSLAAALQTVSISLPIVVAMYYLIHKYILKRCWGYVRGWNKYRPLLDSTNAIMHHRSMGKSSDFTQYY